MQHRDALPPHVAETVQRHILRAAVRIDVYDQLRATSGFAYMAFWWFGFLFNCGNMLNRRATNDWTMWVPLLLWANYTWRAVKMAYVSGRDAPSPLLVAADDARPHRDDMSPEDEARRQLCRRLVLEFISDGPNRLRL